MPSLNITAIRPQAPLSRSTLILLGDDELRSRYTLVGGLVSGDHVAERMSDHTDQAISLVAKWIVAQRVVYVSLNGQLMLPAFQFDWVHGIPYSVVTDALDALRYWQDDREIASWFVTPNMSLNDEWPLSLLHHDNCAVLSAARATNYEAIHS